MSVDPIDVVGGSFDESMVECDGIEVGDSPCGGIALVVSNDEDEFGIILDRDAARGILSDLMDAMAERGWMGGS